MRNVFKKRQVFALKGSVQPPNSKVPVVTKANWFFENTTSNYFYLKTKAYHTQNQ